MESETRHKESEALSAAAECSAMGWGRRLSAWQFVRTAALVPPLLLLYQVIEGPTRPLPPARRHTVYTIWIVLLVLSMLVSQWTILSTARIRRTMAVRWHLRLRDLIAALLVAGVVLTAGSLGQWSRLSKLLTLLVVMALPLTTLAELDIERYGQPPFVAAEPCSREALFLYQIPFHVVAVGTGLVVGVKLLMLADTIAGALQ